MDKFDLNTGFDPKPISNDAALLTPNSLQGKNPPAANNMSNRDKAIAGLNKLAVTSNVPDENYYQKPFAFDAGIDGHNFERYYAHPKFKDLGFSPFRDNETRYNNNSSLWDDTQRAVPQFGKMVGLAVSDIYGNWGDFLSGTPSTDSSEEMRKAMAIGSSSRDTFGAKALNFGVNFAYTAGIAGSIVAEEFALAALEAYTIGGATPLVAAKTAANALKLKNAFKRLGDIYDVTKDLTKAKTAWDMSKGVGAFSRAVLPFQSTADLFRKSGRAAQDWDKLSDYAKAYKSFGAFYRDLREINLVTSESKLEGGGVQVRTAQELLGAFREREGRDPNEAEYTQIYNEARKAGFTASYANMAGIYASNKVVLNRLLKGIPGIAAAEHRAAKTLKSTIIKNEGWRVKGVDPFSKVANNYKRFYNKEWLKQTVKGSPKSGLRFLTANFMEGTQEVYQEAVAEGVTKYYVDKYTQPTQAHRALMKHAIEHGLKSQVSGQGLEVFLSGFLMAAPMQAAGAAMKWGYDYKKIYDLKKKEAAFTADPSNQGKTNPYTEAIKREKEWDDQVLTALNDITKNSGEFFSAVERNVNSQKDLTELFEDATLNNDTKTAIETRDDALFEHVTTLIDSDTVDLFKDQLKDLRQLSDEDLAEAFNEHGQKTDGKSVRERIDSSLKRIEEIESAYERSKNLINPYDFMENPLEYLGFKEATRLMIFNEFAFKRTGDRMLSVQEDLVRKLGLGKIQYIDIAPLFSKGSAMNTGAATPTTTMGMDYEISLLEEQIKVYKQGSPEQQRMAKQLEDKKGTLSSLNLAVQNFVQRLRLTNSPNLSQADTEAYTEDLGQAEELLRKAFSDHLKTLSEQSGEPILDQNIDEAFNSYKDYWRLSHDKTYLANAINQLHNPEIFKENAGRITEALREADRIKAEKAKEIVREYRTKYAKNTFLNDLLEKYNVYVSFEEADAYTDNEKVPSVFYDANTGKEISPYTDPDKYNKITELIDEYDQIHFDITGRRLFKPNRQDTGVRVAGTIKDTDKVAGQLVGQFDPEDKRTYDEIASQFGFDKKEQSSQVNAGTILKAIIDSKFSSATQKELARKLMTLVDPTTLITFRKNLYVHSAYTPASGILVDARYSSSDYQNIVGIPMEYSILNAIGQKVVADALSTDEAFSNRIEELMELAKNGISEKERPYFAYALNNKLNFAMEVLNNRDFQEMLNTIEYSGELTKQTAEAKTLWGTFLETLKDLLDALLNITDPKLLNEAMTVITNKLSTSSIPPTKEKAPEGPGPKPTETIDYTDPVLINKLRAKYESVLAKAAPGEQVGSFDSWMRTNSEALEIARTHSIKKKVGAEGGSQNMTRDAIVRKLTSIGKTVQELNDMSDTEIADLLNRFDQLSAAYTPNLNDQDWGEVDVAMKQAFDKVAAAGITLKDDKTAYEQTVLVGGQTIQKTFERVSNVVKKKKGEATQKVDEVSTQRGNIIDKLFKEFFKGNLQNIDDFEAAYKEAQKDNPLVTFDAKALREVFDTARVAQNKLKEAGLKVIPDFPILFGKLGETLTAGEMDILAYNKQGQVFIIDIKTAVDTNRRFAYEVNTEFKKILGDKYFEFIKALKENQNMIQKSIEAFSEKDPDLAVLLAEKFLDISDRYSREKGLVAQNKDFKLYLGYQEDDLRQQLAYKELLRQVTGLQVTSLSILPVTVSNSPTNRSVVTSAKLIPDKELQPDGTLQPKPKASLLLTIDNSKTIYDLNLTDITQTVTEYPENPLAKEPVKKEATEEVPVEEEVIITEEEIDEKEEVKDEKKGKQKDPKAKEKGAVKRKLSDLRASINKIETKDDMSKFRLLLTTAQELGILDEIKDKQGITPEVFKALMDQKLRQIENQITIAQLTSTEGPVTFTFLNKKGEKRTGIVVGVVDGSKLEIKDITDEIETSPSDWSFAGSGKSIILSERDVNKRVLAITEQPDLPKPDKGTKEKSNAGEEVSGNDLEARREEMKKIDINDPNAAESAADDLFTCDTDTPS